MRVLVKLSAQDRHRFEEVMKDPLLSNKKIAIRLAISLGLEKLVQGNDVVQSGNEILKFNTGTIDPEGIFGVVAYYIISKRLGASKDKNKIILASKQEIADKLAEAFILGLKELHEYQWS